MREQRFSKNSPPISRAADVTLLLSQAGHLLQCFPGNSQPRPSRSSSAGLPGSNPAQGRCWPVTSLLLAGRESQDVPRVEPVMVGSRCWKPGVFHHKELQRPKKKQFVIKKKNEIYKRVLAYRGSAAANPPTEL